MSDYIKAANDALAERKRLAEQRKALLDDTVLSDAEKRERWEALDTDIDRLGKDADRYVRANEDEAETRALTERAARLSGGASPDQRKSTRDEASELRDLAAGRRADVVFDIGTADFRTALTSVASNAGNTKPTATFVGEVFSAMRERSQFFQYCRTLNTESGETLEMPVKNNLDPSLAPMQGTTGIVVENNPIPKVDQQWSKVNLGAYKYGIIFEISAELIQDTAIPLMAILGADAGETLADKVMAHLMTGTGTAQPFGWVTRTTTSGVNAATVSAITFDNVLDLQFSVKAPYRRAGVYMFNDSVNPVLRKLKDGQQRYLWEPSVQAGMPDTIWGKPVLTDPNIATAGAGAKVGVFGDPSKYILRQVRDLKVTRSDEYGFDRDVTAFKLTWRGDGNLFDQNSVKALTVTA